MYMFNRCLLHLKMMYGNVKSSACCCKHTCCVLIHFFCNIYFTKTSPSLIYYLLIQKLLENEKSCLLRTVQRVALLTHY